MSCITDVRQQIRRPVGGGVEKPFRIESSAVHADADKRRDAGRTEVGRAPMGRVRTGLVRFRAVVHQLAAVADRNVDDAAGDVGHDDAGGNDAA